LVPNVKMKVHSGSSASLSSTVSYPVSSRRSVRSPLRHTTDEDATASLPVPRRPVVESELLLVSTFRVSLTSSLARSWSYDNLKTYPIMQLPPKKETRIETQIIDGVERQVKVEVEVTPPVKRLFLFPGKEISPTYR
jgi:hypothetical protein